MQFEFGPDFAACFCKASLISNPPSTRLYQSNYALKTATVILLGNKEVLVSPPKRLLLGLGLGRLMSVALQH